MTAAQISTAIRTVIAEIIGWLKIIAAFILALAVLGILTTMLGYRVPYLPSFKAGLQETGVFIAAVSYWLSR